MAWGGGWEGAGPRPPRRGTQLNNRAEARTQAYFRSFSNASRKSSLVITVQNMFLLMSVFILCFRASSSIFELTWKEGRPGVDHTDVSVKVVLWFSVATKFLRSNMCNSVA